MSARTAAKVKVPLWRALKQAIGQVLGDLKAAGRLGWLPFLILLLFSAGQEVVSASGLWAALLVRGLLGAFSFLEFTMQALCCTAFVVAWYRHVLQAREDTRGFWRAFWRVFGYYALLLIGNLLCGGIAEALIRWGALTIVAAASLQTVNAFRVASTATQVVIGAVAIALFTRSSLVFPAVASGRSLSLRQAWRKMRGNTWRLIAALAFVTIPWFTMSVAVLVFGSHASAQNFSVGLTKVSVGPLILAIGAGGFFRVILLLFLALLCSVVAIFYRELVQRPADEAEVFV
jgi:hypothetical protein